MGNDSKGLDDPGRTPATQGSPDAAVETGADALNAIGYEAADPSLHAPLWREAVQAGPTGRVPR
jgi:hypothetical protein